MEDQRCSVRVLQIYLDRTSSFRRSDQVFISWGYPISKPLSLACGSYIFMKLRECSLQGASEHTPLGVWLPLGLCLRELPYKTNVPLQAGTLPICKSDTTSLMLPGTLCTLVRGGLLPGIGYTFLSIKPYLVQLDSSAEVKYGCPSHRWNTRCFRELGL